jgi:hypothetical protein
MKGDNAVDTTAVKTGANSDYVVQLDFRIPSDVELVSTYSIINLGNWPGPERVMLCASEGKSKNQFVLKAQLKGNFVDLTGTYSKGETYTAVLHFIPGKQVDYFVGTGIKLSYLYTGETNTNEITKVRQCSTILQPQIGTRSLLCSSKIFLPCLSNAR